MLSNNHSLTNLLQVTYKLYHMLSNNHSLTQTPVYTEHLSWYQGGSVFTGIPHIQNLIRLEAGTLKKPY
jgi:hypothetical protein